MSEGGRPDQYWFCLKHHRVETIESAAYGMPGWKLPSVTRNR